MSRELTHLPDDITVQRVMEVLRPFATCWRAFNDFGIRHTLTDTEFGRLREKLWPALEAASELSREIETAERVAYLSEDSA